MVMELARRLGKRTDPLPRRVVFMAFSGEEKGLLGSRHYVDHPLYRARQDGHDGQLRHGRPAQREERADHGRPREHAGAGGDRRRARHGRGVQGQEGQGGVRRLRRVRPRVVLPEEDPGPLPVHRAPRATTTARATTPSGSTSPGCSGSPTSANSSCSTSPAAPSAPRSSAAEPAKNPHAGRDAAGRSDPGRIGVGAYLGTVPDYGSEEKGVKLADVRENGPAAKGGPQGRRPDRRLRRQADLQHLRLHRQPRPGQAGRWWTSSSSGTARK